MIESIRYVVFRNNDDSVATLGRLVDDGVGLWGEEFHDGRWLESKAPLEALTDSGYPEMISFEEAKLIASQLGITLSETDHPANN